jgi:hypothetical protein
LLTLTNPFTERARVTNPARFTGRWGELSMIFERMEAGRPVLVTGAPGIGKSSLLTHVMQSAAANLDEPEMHAYYLDLADAAGLSDVYRAVIEALAGRGDTLAALEVGVIAAKAPVLICLDNTHIALRAGWGERLLEELARLARGSQLLLVAAMEGAPPQLSERFAVVTLGAFAAPEVRLFVDAYLDDTGVTFTPAEIRQLAELSAAHPAYLQRAAFHLFQSKIEQGFNWRAAYLDEAREQPIPGAPLPPEVFSGGEGSAANSTYGDAQDEADAGAPGQLQLPTIDPVLRFAVPLVLAALLFVITQSVALTLGVGVVGLALVGVGVWQARKRD